ncbi:MAG: ABC-F family ATP-binding cassette domain-containing protein [Rhodothermaceae bacterium]
MLDVINLSMQYGGKYLFDNTNFKINKGDKIALVGSNGTGKSTLLKLLKGTEESESGRIDMPKGTKIGYLSQEFTDLKGKTLFNEVKTSLGEISQLQQKEDELQLALSDDTLDENTKLDLSQQLGEINTRKEEIDFYRVDSNIEKVLMGLGFSVSDFNRMTDEFSGGWQMRIELAKILLDTNDIILLDEPTNHLDIDTLQWLINFLKASKVSAVIVSHDKYFVNEVTNRTLEIFNKKISGFNGNYDAYLKFKEERDEQLEAEFIQQQKKIKETEKFIERFRYKATKAKQVQSRVKQLEKIDLVELTNQEKSITIRFPEPERSGAIPVEMNGISKAYGSNKVFENLDFKVERGEKIAFVGPNGAGKTTLAKLIANKIQPNQGDILLGHNTFISYYAQEVAENLNPELDLLESVAEIGTEYTLPQLRSLLGTFLFSSDDVFKKISVLSGGEKSRVALAKILLTKANLIILDEPTNHLDASSKAVLQEALKEFSGTLIIVSHDVDFLRPVINKVIEIRRGEFNTFAGDIDYYLSKKNAEAIDASNNKGVSQAQEKSTRKDQKRLEAELRQKRYKATKEVVKAIEKIELEIEKLEEKKTAIEGDLASEETFSNPAVAKEKNAEYEETKKQLEKVYEKWSSLNEELEEIERNIN